MSKKRLSQIDAWRGFAIFCVVLYHSIIVYPVNLQLNETLKSLYDYISVFNMPLFFFISGVCFSYKSDYKEYINKKVKRILVPYLFVSILNMLCKLVLPGVVNKQVNIKDFLVEVFLYGGEYWFLYVMFIILLIYPFVIKISKYVNKYIIESFFIILSLIKINTSIFCLVPLLRYFVYFNTGYLLKDIVKKYIDKDIKIYIPLTIFIISIFIFVINNKYDIRLVEMVNALIIIFATYLLANNKHFIGVFEKYGRYSLQIYCLNGFLLVFARTIICKITNLAIVIVPFILLICLCLSYFVIKYILAKIGVARFLLGLQK